MKRQGATDRQIADQLGYKTGQSVKRLIQEGLDTHQYAEHEIEVYRTYFLADLLKQLEVSNDTIRHPGYLYDVKGNLVEGPDGGYQENISERTKAQDLHRHLQESARRLLGVDAPQRKVRKNTIIIRQIQEIAGQLGIAVDDDDIVEAEVVSESHRPYDSQARDADDD